MDLVSIEDAQLEVYDCGSGEPLVFIQTALTAEELRPLSEQPVFADYRRILYHRRGYGASTPVQGPGSVKRDASDCRSILDALSISRAHILGYSYSAAVALQLTSEAPEYVATLILLEPPPTQTPSNTQFRVLNEELLEARKSKGPDIALDQFLSIVVGPQWRSEIEALLPGATAQMEGDATTFFDTDLPALLAWQFSEEDCARIACPVLYVGGTESGKLFNEVRDLMLEWLPQAQDSRVPSATHSMTLTHVTRVAEVIATFLRSHPLSL